MPIAAFGTEGTVTEAGVEMLVGEASVVKAGSWVPVEDEAGVEVGISIEIKVSVKDKTAVKAEALAEERVQGENE